MARRVRRYRYPIVFPKGVVPPKPERDFFRTGYGRTRWNPAGIHVGLDLGGRVSHRRPVVAVATIRLTFAGWAGDLGRLVKGRDAFGIEWGYAHLDSFGKFKVGDKVRKGRDVIGRQGTSGNTRGSHLHLFMQAKRASWGRAPYLDPFPIVYDAWKDYRDRVRAGKAGP